MPRKKPADAAPEPTTETPDSVPAGESGGDGPAKPVTKSQAMDAAMAAGADMPAEGVAYVKEHFGLEVSNKQFSTHKSMVKQMAAIDARPKSAKPLPVPKTAVAKATPVPAAVEPATPPPAPVRPAASAADLARQIKSLVADHGAGAVGEMLDVFRE